MQAERKEIGWFEIIIRLIYKGIKFTLKFSIYLCVRFLQMIIDFISNLLDLDNFLNRDEDEYSLLNVEVTGAESTHEYKFKRSKLYNLKYEEIEELLDCADNYEVCIKKDMAEDILKKINVLVFEAEKNALREGYKFSKETKYQLNEDDVYPNYIKDRVMRGE